MCNRGGVIFREAPGGEVFFIHTNAIELNATLYLFVSLKLMLFNC